MRRAALIAASAIVLASGAASAAEPPRTILASVSGDAAQADADALRAAISADGRFIAFSSAASNLVADDTNGATDVFVHDAVTGATERVSIATDGSPASGDSADPSISADGSIVAFASGAPDLVAGDANGATDIFVHDRSTGVTTRVSVSSGAVETNGHSMQPSLSADGTAIAFASDASNLVAGDTNGARDVFVHHRVAGVTDRVSVADEQASDASWDPSVSADGNGIAFVSAAPNLVADDTNGVADVFVRELGSSTTVRASVATGGSQAIAASVEPSLSADGRVVAFSSASPDLVAGDTNGFSDVFVRDLTAGATRRVSLTSTGGEAFGWSVSPSISSDGLVVAFHSFAADLVPLDTNGWPDVFVHDLTVARTSRTSVDTAGEQAEDGGSIVPAISSDGRFVAFTSRASDLVASDRNDNWDIFVRDRGTRYCGAGERAEGSVSGRIGPMAVPPDPALRDEIGCALVEQGL